jgi:hypothetical protein
MFVNVAKNIGNNQINVDGDHPSILEIKNNHPELLENSFSFSSIYPDFVEKRTFSDKTVSFWFTLPLFVKKGLTVGQKSLDLGPPTHLSIKYVFIDLLLSLVT